MKSKSRKNWILKYCLVIVFVVVLLLLVLVTESGKSEGKIITVDDDGTANYTTIQKAIYEAEPGDTIQVFPGIYRESIGINRSVSLIGSGPENTTIDGCRDWKTIGIYAKNVRIEGFSIIRSKRKGDSSGLKISKGSATISGNVFRDHERGITIDREYSKLLIVNNSFEDMNVGVFCRYAKNSTLENNSFSQIWSTSVYLSSSQNIIMKNNTMADVGITIRGYLHLKYWNTHRIDSSNQLNSRPVYFLKNVSGGSVPDDGGQLILVSCSNLTIRNMNFSNGHAGVLLGYSIDCHFENCNFSSNYKSGAELFYSNNNTFLHSSFLWNRMHGIHIGGGSKGNVFSNCTSEGNRNGIQFEDCSENRIEQSLCTENQEHGVLFDDGNRNVIENTIISHNARGGIYFDWKSDYNSFLNCTIDSNNWSSVVSGDHNLFENCAFLNTNDSGLSIEVYGRYTKVVNCSFINNTWYGIYVSYRKDDDWDPLIQEDNYFENNKRGKVKYEEHDPTEYSLFDRLFMLFCLLLIATPIVVVIAIKDILDGQRRRRVWPFLPRRPLPRYKLFIVIFLLTMVLLYTGLVIALLEYYIGGGIIGYAPHPMYPIVVLAPCCLIFLIIVFIPYVAHIIAERKMARQLLHSPPPVYNSPYQPLYQPPYGPLHLPPPPCSNRSPPLRYTYRSVHPETNATDSRTDEPEEEIMKCLSCGSRIENDAASCQTCGEAITQRKNSSDPVTDEE